MSSAVMIVGVLLVLSCSGDDDGETVSAGSSTDASQSEGGDDSVVDGADVDVSPEAAAWAEEVCGSLETWSQELATLADEVETEADAGDLSGLRTTVASAIDATQALLDELDAIEAPSAEDGESVQQQLDELGEQAEAGLGEVEQGLDALDQAESAEEGLQALLDVAQGVGEQLGSVDEALSELEERDQGSELVAALRADPACQSLES